MSRTVRGLVDEVILAHGGLAAWDRAGSVSVRFAARGLAFAMRGQRHALEDTTAVVSTTAQSIQMSGTSPQPWSFEAAEGGELRRAATQLRRGRRRVHWTPEDVGTFAALAMWTYLNVPFCLASDEVSTRALPPGRDGSRRLAMHFPGSIATHSPDQVLHIDYEGIIRRHDYTALAFGRWARAAQQLDHHEWFDGILIPTTRVVTPRLPGGRAAGAPTLVRIEVRDVTLQPRRPAGG